MATFYWNSVKKEDIVTQWIDHLQHEEYVKDVDQIIRKNSTEIRKSIESGSKQQIEAIGNICGQIEDMNLYLSTLNYNISELRGEMNAFASMMDWKLSQMIEEQRITNQLLGFISELLRIPDSQKQRVYHIEQGLKYLKNAFMENDVNSSFYIDAMEELKKAETIERKDFITLNRIGQIYLYSKKFLDFEKAEDYFVRSARESHAEANVNGTTVSNNLSPKGFENEMHFSNPFIAATAESYLYAGRACYLQGKLEQAAEFAGKAYDLIPEFLQAGFEHAKYFASKGQTEQAAKLLGKIISKDRLFAIKTLKDGDLYSKKEIIELLQNLNSRSFGIAKESWNKLNRKALVDTKANSILSEIKLHYSKNNYLSNMHALDMLNSEYELPYYVNRTDENTVYRNLAKPTLTIHEFLEKETESELEFDTFYEKVRKNIHSTKMTEFGASGGGIGMFIGFFQACSPSGKILLDLRIWIAYIVGTICLGVFLGFIVGKFTKPKIRIYDV